MKQGFQKLINSPWVFGAIGFLVFLIVVIRILNVDATYDEVWTIETFTTIGWEEIVKCEPCDANNHVLNGLLIKAFTTVLVPKLYVARLPNLLALVLYLFFAFKIARHYLRGPVDYFFT